VLSSRQTPAEQAIPSLGIGARGSTRFIEIALASDTAVASRTTRDLDISMSSGY
jgi:hypothetical protein